MSRYSPIIVVLLGSLALVPAAAAAPAAEPAPPPRSEWLGLEASPLWLQIYRTPDFQPNHGLDRSDASRIAAGLALTIRLLRLRFADFYWTPLQAGAGIGGPDLHLLAHVSTEIGRRLPWFSRRLELGAAAGRGGVSIPYGEGCDGSCYVGGGPVVVSPVLRWSLRQGERITWALLARAVIPLGRQTDRSNPFRGLGSSLLLGLELGVNRL